MLFTFVASFIRSFHWIAGGAAAPPPPGVALFVYQVAPSVTETDLVSLFSAYGQVLAVKMMVDLHTHIQKVVPAPAHAAPLSTGIVFVLYQDMVAV